MSAPGGRGDDAMANPITDKMRARGLNFDRTDEDLLRYAVQIATVSGQRVPRWVAVRYAFGLGSTSGAALCLACGFNPDEMVGYPADGEE